MLLEQNIVKNRRLTNIEYDKYGKRKEKGIPFLGINKKGVGIYWNDDNKPRKLYRLNIKNLKEIKWDEFLDSMKEKRIDDYKIEMLGYVEKYLKRYNMRYPMLKRKVDMVLNLGDDKIDQMDIKLYETSFKYKKQLIYNVIDSSNIYNLFKNDNDLELWMNATNKLTQKIREINENNTIVLEDIKNDVEYILVYNAI